MEAFCRLAGGSRRIVLGLLAGAAIAVAVVSPATAQWRVIPEIRLTGGEESDLVVDPELTSAVVPGGPFTEISPAFAGRRWLGSRGLVSFRTFATVQQFHNDEARRLYAHTVAGDAFWNSGGGLRARISVSGDYFDDSQRESVRRFGVGGETGLAVVGTRGSAELWAGARARRYPNIDVQTDLRRVSTYAEATWSGGTTLRLIPHERFALGADGILQRTDSRDPLFDSESRTVFASADARLTSRLFATVSGTYQERQFTERTAGENGDEYRQVGAGLRYVLFAGWDLLLRWGYSTYTWPDQSEDDSHRIAVGIQYKWGRPRAPLLPPVDLQTLARESGGAVQQRDSQGNVHFRIHSPGATAVSVAGSFNGWDAGATPLVSSGGGWWETRIFLIPGTYEYAYVIDGRWTTPPEAPFTAEDGFGGNNGILEILPSDV